MKYYEENAKIFFETTVDANMNETYEIFEKYLKKDAHIVDIGCGSGRDSRHFKNKGYKITATDISIELSKLAEKLIGQEVIIQNVLNMSEQEEYDAVWACASLLHVNKKNIKKAFENLYNSLKNGGILYASFKYGVGEREADNRVFNDYTEETMKEFLRETNFNLQEIWITGDVRVGRENEKWLNIIIKK